MRGYVTFLLVLASLFFTLILIGASQKPYDISFSRAIAAERTCGVAMNSKEVAAEAMRQGGLEGFRIYNSTHSQAICNNPDLGGQLNFFCFRIEEAKIWVIEGAFYNLATLDKTAFDPEMDVRLYCAPLVSDDMMREHAKQIRAGSLVCSGCKEFNTTANNISELAQGIIDSLPKDTDGLPDYSAAQLPLCMASIIPQITSNLDPNENPDLTSITIDNPLVVSVYYPDFNVSAVSYLPASYKIYEANP